MKKRLLYYQIQKYFESKEAIIVTGMRQVGKTTLLKQVFDEIGDVPKLWFDFDNPFDQKVFEDIDYSVIYKRLSEMTKKGRLYVFIDEIQNFPEITKVIKYLIDHYQVKFFVTGSSNYYMKNLFPESLSGRKFLFDLTPLSFQEFLYFKDQKELKDVKDVSSVDKILGKSSIFEHKKYEAFFESFMEFGGFPEVVLADDNETKKIILKNIFKSFFEKDIKVLSDISEVKELRDLLLLLVPRVGSMLDITKISSELGVERPKIYKYLELLQSVFVIRLIPKFSKSIDRTVAGGKKVYFSDTGLLNTIGNVNDGQLFENTLVNELSSFGKLSFYNERNVSEIDLILDNIYAFEVKLNGTEQDMAKLRVLSEKIGVKNSIVVSRKFVDKENFISPVIF